MLLNQVNNYKIYINYVKICVVFFLDSYNMCCCDLLDCGCYASMFTGLNKIQIYKFFKKKKKLIKLNYILFYF